MKNIHTFLAGLLFALFACNAEAKTVKFTVKNHLDINRTETVSIPAGKIQSLIDKFGAANILIKDAASGSILVSQPVDNNGDGKTDEILFQATLKGKEEKSFVIEGNKKGAAMQPKSPVTTYSRFVPERIDDYAWENDRVAFRTYGPKAQQITESGKPGGTLTSGMDCWLKRVQHPVIDSWYKKNLTQAGYYHTDHGEGYDPYHVGDSRGCGGIGVWDNDSLWVSKNFISYKTIAVGPIRTIFELTYAPWAANGRKISEKKRISLDLGSNFSRFEVTLEADKTLPNCVIGITLHEKSGETKSDSTKGWFRYWESVDNQGLGTAVVINPANVLGYRDFRTTKKDQSHLMIFAKPENSITYFAGFGWVKSKQFATPAEWDAHLTEFAQRLASPVQVNF